MRLIILIGCLLSAITTFAQDSLLTISGYADLYFAYDFNNPADKNRQYTTQPFRHNEFNLNWGFIQTNYLNGPIRSVFALHTGTYVQSNYANEPDILRHIYQASVGYQLTDRIGFDVGIMPSHIGMESTVSIDNWNYSRNIQSDYSPYYQAGAQLSIDMHPKLKAKFLVLNGFQIIKENNNAKSIGLLLNYYPAKNWEIGYSNYFGNEAPTDSIIVNDQKRLISNKHRFFNNLYLKAAVSEKICFAVIGEFNVQQHFLKDDLARWYTVVATAKYQFTKKVSLAARGEYFSDQDQIVTVTATGNGFRVRSYSATLNIYPSDKFAFRIEGRTFKSADPVFLKNSVLQRDVSSVITASCALKF